MHRASACLLALAGLFASASPASAQFTPTYETVAITEFMVHPIGGGHGRQWVEFYNFGKDVVDLEGFQLYDEGNKMCDFPKIKIAPNDFAVIVLGHDHHHYNFAEDRKKIFEAEWLGGKEDPRVFFVRSSYVLGSVDTLILRNRRRTPIWILGWRSDDKAGNSTYLAIDNFSIRHYGTKEKPSINRNGPDGTVAGYEGQFAKQEEVAWKSDVSKLEAIGGVTYKTLEAGGKIAPSIGSPLKGNYPGAKNN